jgi:hypothetical protein
MSETNKDITVAFYKKALFEGRVEEAFRLYAVPTYRQHNPTRAVTAAFCNRQRRQGRSYSRAANRCGRRCPSRPPSIR